MVEEKILILNLRKDLVKTPKWRRSKSIASLLRKRVAKFSKTGKVKIDAKISEQLWSRGIKSPPTHLKVKIKKLDDGSVEAQLAG